MRCRDSVSCAHMLHPSARSLKIEKNTPNNIRNSNAVRVFGGRARAREQERIFLFAFLDFIVVQYTLSGSKFNNFVKNYIRWRELCAAKKRKRDERKKKVHTGTLVAVKQPAHGKSIISFFAYSVFRLKTVERGVWRSRHVVTMHTCIHTRNEWRAWCRRRRGFTIFSSDAHGTRQSSGEFSVILWHLTFQILQLKVLWAAGEHRIRYFVACLCTASADMPPKRYTIMTWNKSILFARFCLWGAVNSIIWIFIRNYFVRNALAVLFMFCVKIVSPFAYSLSYTIVFRSESWRFLTLPRFATKYANSFEIVHEFY